MAYRRLTVGSNHKDPSSDSQRALSALWALIVSAVGRPLKLWSNSGESWSLKSWQKWKFAPIFTTTPHYYVVVTMLIFGLNISTTLVFWQAARSTACIDKQPVVRLVSVRTQHNANLGSRRQSLSPPYFRPRVRRIAPNTQSRANGLVSNPKHLPPNMKPRRNLHWMIYPTLRATFSEAA